LFSRGCKGASDARDIVRRRARERRLGKINGDRSGKDSVFQFSVHSLGDEFLLIA
jgi:hypothetical protein